MWISYALSKWRFSCSCSLSGHDISTFWLRWCQLIEHKMSQIWHFLSIESKNVTKLANEYDIKSIGYIGPPIFLTSIEPSIVSIFEHIVRCLLNTSLWCLFLDPHLTTYHSNKGVQIIAMFGIRHVQCKNSHQAPSQHWLFNKGCWYPPLIKCLMEVKC